MKKTALIFLILTSAVLLASCGSDAPLTESQQAAQYNMTIEEYKEMKDAAARMNMTIEEHMKMTDTDGEMDHSMMDMDDSDMIEDDMEMSGSHDMGDGTMMDNDMKMEGKHVMDDGSVMADDEMHMEMMHADDDIEEHDADEHGEHE